jgi:hypothetical protein
MNKKNKTVTVKFTAAEAAWLLVQLERDASEAREQVAKAKHSAERDSYLLLKFQAESLSDRIRSES